MSYYGYQRRDKEDFLDIGALVEEASSGIIAARAENEKRKEELEAYDDELRKTMSDWQPGEDRNLNDMVLRGAQNITGNINDWMNQMKRGEITPNEWKARIENLQTNWGMLANTTNNYEKVHQEVTKMIADGEMNAFGEWMFEKNARLLDIPSSNFETDDRGNVWLVARNDNGEVISKKDTRQLANQYNIIDKKYDLDSDVDAMVKSWEPYLKEDPNRKLKDITLNPAYEDAKIGVVSSILSSDRQVTSILTERSGEEFRFYENEADKKDQVNNVVRMQVETAKMLKKPMSPEQIAQFKSEIEDRMIKVIETPSGQYEPAPTSKQKEMAAEVVNNAIDIRFGKEDVKKDPKRYSSGNGGGGNNNQQGGTVDNKAVTLNSAWTGKHSRDVRSGLITQALKDGYKAEIDDKGTVHIYKWKPGMNLTTDGELKYDWVPVDNFPWKGSSPKRILKYAYTTATIKGKVNTPEDQYRMDRELGGLNSNSGGGGASGSGGKAR